MAMIASSSVNVFRDFQCLAQLGALFGWVRFGLCVCYHDLGGFLHVYSFDVSQESPHFMGMMVAHMAFFLCNFDFDYFAQVSGNDLAH